MITGVSITIIQDTRNAKKSGLYPVKLRVIFNREPKYYPTGIDLSKEDFDKVISSQKPRAAERELRDRLSDFEAKARGIIKDMPYFDFATFDLKYRQKRNPDGGLKHFFDEYIKALSAEGQLNTAETYRCSIVSLQKFKDKLKPYDITPAFLKKYTAWMLETEGNSISTVGIYLRPLRSILNHYKLIPEEAFPFGKERDGKYEIRTATNKKKALTFEEIERIYLHPTETGSSQDKAKDLWLFIYMANGMNVKDLCYLRYSNISGRFISFERQKTAHTKRDKSKIQVSYSEELRQIVTKWGNKTISPKGYVFPFMREGMTEAQKRNKVKDTTKFINQHMKDIARALGIDKDLTTYAARHSFATVLKRSGATTAMIREMMDHSSENVTQRYLDSFESEQIHEVASKLTAFKAKTS